jgi:hypothetical protein
MVKNLLKLENDNDNKILTINELNNGIFVSRSDKKICLNYFKAFYISEN